jgi:hypothetical protein
MSRQVLVPLKGRDRIEEFLPYVEDLALPGTKIVFLIHFGTSHYKELAGQLLAFQTGAPANSSLDRTAPQNLADRESTVERQFRIAGEELRSRGVKIEVKFYTGSLRKMVREYVQSDPVQLVMMSRGRNRVLSWLRQIGLSLRVAQPSLAMPVLLCHPTDFPRREL